MAAKLIGYARVSTRGQGTDRQVADLLAAGVRRDDLYVDHGASGALARRPELDRAMAALEPGDTRVVCTLDRLGRNTSAMLDLAASLRTSHASSVAFQSAVTPTRMRSSGSGSCARSRTSPRS
ncbi:recombinase family protein [Propionibacteriaceae bacterium G57]|uniref:recombinase family protein n=1 Tax=Aestuariimicrobium sp. G57 TaxID=3418485 RepID=UPI003DA71896